jgi:hypothetical protein
MKRFTILGVLVVLLATVPAAPQGATDQGPQSAAAAASLTALLDRLHLEAIVAPDPEESGRYVAALYIPGSLLLAVSAPYPVPAAIDKRIAEGQYMDAYLDIQGQANRQGHFFVVDSLADGLTRVCESEHPFDSTTINGGTTVSYDGKWFTQKLSEEDYNARFSRDDARYARMLKVLTTALNRKTTEP